MRWVAALAILLSCAKAENPGSVFYCTKDKSCSLMCSAEPCTTQATAACARTPTTFLCYADEADCIAARGIVRLLGECKRATPAEMLPR